MAVITPEHQRNNQLASDWMHCGFDLLEAKGADAPQQALRCFDQALALRRTLPWKEDHFLRYGLSACWINRADALAQVGDDHSLAEAMTSYDEALLLLETLPLEANLLYPRRLAIAWINRGVALQKQDAAGAVREAAQCFREAIGVLECDSAARVEDRSSLQAGAWANLAGALAHHEGSTCLDVATAANRALKLTQASEQADVAMADAALQARLAFCRIVTRDLAAQKPVTVDALAMATRAADEGVALAARWMRNGHAAFEEIAAKIFRLGCRIHERSQPQPLARFLLEALDSGAIALRHRPEAFAAAQAAIWRALEHLHTGGFHNPASPAFDAFLSDVRELRQVEERLGSLRQPRAALHLEVVSH